jgi:hypothetical protein
VVDAGWRASRSDPASAVLRIHESSSQQELAAAAQRLRRGEGAVELEGVTTLVPEHGGIVAEIRLDAGSAAMRCAEEFKVLIENASRALANSALAAHLPPHVVHWRVVQEAHQARVQLWPLA